MPEKIRIGIIGAGGMGNVHADQFKKIPGVELSSCLDVVPGRAAAYASQHRVAHVAENLDELLDRVDAVSVVTPDRHHAALTLAALRVGKHVLCEKPLAVTLAEAREVAAAAEEAGRRGAIHMVNFSYRRSAALRKAVEMVATGKLGPLRHVHSLYFQSWLGAWGHRMKEDSMLWRLQTVAGSGGVLGDLGCHILDLTTAVAGEVSRIRCELRTFPKIERDGTECTQWQGKKLDANDTAVIELEFSGGALGVVQTTRWAIGHLNHLRLEAHGARGALRFDLDRDYRRIDVCLGKAAWDYDNSVREAAWKTITLAEAPSIWQRFVHAVRKGRPDQPDMVRGAQVQAYLDACERSARSGRWEQVRAWK